MVSNVRFRFHRALRKDFKSPSVLTRCEIRKDHFVSNSSLLSQPQSPNSHLRQEALVDSTVPLTPPSSNGIRQGDDCPVKKTEVFILRTDGFSCTREMVDESGSLYFEGTSTHQHVLLWKTRPKW